MKCVDCPAHIWATAHVCLLTYPQIPEQLSQLMNSGVEADFCIMFDEYKRTIGN